MNEVEKPNQEATDMEIESLTENKDSSDKEIKSRIEYTLLLSPYIEHDTMDIDVSKGHVTLNGSVDAFWKKREIKVIAANTKGVVDVIDEIDIVPSREYTDKEITRELKKTIDRRPGVSQEDVDVNVSDGEVTIEGTVPNWFTYSRIKISSENTLGVVDVVDKIKIES